LHTSDEYQDEAIRCLRLAQALEFEPSKAVLLDLAQQWADVATIEPPAKLLAFAAPHSATPSCSKGRLIRCTVPGLTPNRLAMTRTPGLPGVARASRDSSQGFSVRSLRQPQ
jgi:hypothetical protein